MTNGLYFIAQTEEGDGLYFCGGSKCRKWFESRAKASARFYTRREVSKWTAREWDISSALTESFVEVHLKADNEKAVAAKAIKQRKAAAVAANTIKQRKEAAAASSASTSKRKRKR